ncbi:MAG: leucine-rich repeat protein [Paludibacteraceae bacterium]|nr:leucine-rich repeat protein [Paludibacteraceae bacterium]
MKKQILLACVIACATGASAQMNVWENGNLSAQYNVENVDSVTFGITSETPVSGTGKDGITPLLKIENDYWFVSYDNGETWQQEGLARGEKGEKGEQGDKGEKGDKGDSMFLSFEQDSAFVYLLLPDSSKVKIAKVTTDGGYNEEGFIDFKDLAVKAFLLELSPAIDTNLDGEISYKEAANYPYSLKLYNSDIRSFKELKFFTNISSCNIRGENLLEIEFPEQMDSILGLSLAKIKCVKLPKQCKYVNNFNIPKAVTVIANEGLEQIGKDSWTITNLKKLVLPNSLKHILRDYSSDYPTISVRGTSFVFPENLEGQGGCIKALVDTVYWNAINFKENYEHQYTRGLALVTYMSNDAYKYNSDIKAIIFGDKVESIPAYLCCNLTGIKEVMIPDNVKSVGSGAFEGCSNLTTLSLGKGLTQIGGGAFRDCREIDKLTLGENVEEIGNGAFSGCASNMKIYCKAVNPPLLGSSVFPNNTGIVIYVPRASVDEYRILWSNYASRILPYDFE